MVLLKGPYAIQRLYGVRGGLYGVQGGLYGVRGGAVWRATLFKRVVLGRIARTGWVGRAGKGKTGKHGKQGGQGWPAQTGRRSLLGMADLAG